MAKANLLLSRSGNDGYKCARRESDGKWFVKEGYYSQSYGWTTTKWKECGVSSVIETCLEAHEKGLQSAIVGFGHQVIITDGKRIRLPD